MPWTGTTSAGRRVWNYCNVLRDDGVSYGDYVEQLTYLLFLKMADEGARLPAPLAKHQERRGAELHAPPAYQRHRRGDAPSAR